MPRNPPRNRNQPLNPIPNPGVIPVPVTPVPVNTNTSQQSSQSAGNLLRRIKLDFYTGDGDVTPWIAKVKTLVSLDNIQNDAAKVAYVHLHLAGKASAWFNDKGFAHFKTFDELEKALIKEYGVSDGQRQRYRGELLTMEQGDKSVHDIMHGTI